MIEQIKEILISGLAAKLKIHHSLYRLPCTAEYLEEVIASILAENGYINDWEPDRSHKMSVDMSIDNIGSFSVKSGIYDPFKSTLTFSGSRLGKYKTLPEMVNGIISTSADYYICLSKIEKDWKPTPSKSEIKSYYLFMFDKSALKYRSDNWQREESKHGGYKYAMTDIGFKAAIHPTLSYQLWTIVSEDLIGSPTRIDIL
jgi:hypothetical protein